MDTHQTSPFDQSAQVFRGNRFVLLGFDPINKSQVSRKLVSSGGVDAGVYEDCTHVIVDKIAYDDPVCVAARSDGKILVSGLWVEHSFDVGTPVDPTSVMYRPAKDLNGIPGAKSLVICLTGYQREDREDIMTMVKLMGAQFSKPLIANKVTHLICYKFEGEKYLLAKKMKRIKLINHRWLEDCSYGDARRESQEVQNVREELEKERTARVNIEARLEQFERASEQERTEREQERERERAEREKERAEREKERAEQEEWRKNMEDMMKKLAGKK